MKVNKKITTSQRLAVIDEMLSSWATQRYIASGGDKGTYATRRELRMIHEDPRAFLRMLSGEQAYDVVMNYYRRIR